MNSAPSQVIITYYCNKKIINNDILSSPKVYNLDDIDKSIYVLSRPSKTPRSTSINLIMTMNAVKTLRSSAIVFVILFAASSVSHSRIGFDKYHNHKEMTDYLMQITDEFPNISSLYSIGQSVLSTYNASSYFI